MITFKIMIDDRRKCYEKTLRGELIDVRRWEETNETFIKYRATNGKLKYACCAYMIVGVVAI